jgi:hypothetical protein
VMISKVFKQAYRYVLIYVRPRLTALMIGTDDVTCFSYPGIVERLQLRNIRMFQVHAQKRNV